MATEREFLDDCKLLRYPLSIDWPMLTQQKLFLLELIVADCAAPSGLTSLGPYARGDHPLDGLVSLLDSIQDHAEKMGEKVYPQEDE